MGRLLVWEPEKYTRAERRAAASTLIQAQNAIWCQDRNAFGAEHAELVHQLYLRVDDLLTMVYEALYRFDDSDQVPQPPSAS